MKARHMSIQMVPLAAIVPNRYRHIEAYELSESKLESLIQSYQTSGFWDGSIQARPHPTKAGKFEIAFGHHRLEAAKRAGTITELGLVVADRSDADMLRMMADENRDEFRADALVGVETIAAVIGAFGRGEIELPAVDPKAKRETIHHLPGGRSYTLPTVAAFLGWIKPSTGEPTSACRRAYEGYQMRATTAAALQSIPSAQRSEIAMRTVVQAATSARKAAEDAHLTPTQTRQAEKAAAEAAAAEVRERSGFKASADATTIGHAAVAQITLKKSRSGPPVDFYIAKLIRKCTEIEPYQSILEECRRLIPFVDDLNRDQTRELAAALEAMLTRSATGVSHVAQALRSNQPTKLRKLLEA